ncbi:hypothetical protein SASC598O11_000210 [Snodgrassella alvi SCGC AB-598-O11]|nr:hypothetical protein SASC598O11_000210 [Snodgrassella alvi SCGC AB-598-O11]
MYYYGKGVEQSFIKSIEYYKSAAEQGNSDAQFALGFMYINGEGAEQNYAEAYEYFNLAAEQGHCGALHNLELMKKIVLE